MNTSVRVRFAPSPTGPLHIGGLRTALYNYLFAKKHSGQFILRIEDTDQSRYVEGAEQYIKEALDWSGLTLDESPDNPGEFGPYRQSERQHIYGQYAQKLIDSGHAYYAFDTAEELDKLRKERESKGETFTYNSQNRTHLNNSLNLSEEECQKLLDEGQPYVIRFKMPMAKQLLISDIIRGNIQVRTDALDDKILFKSDGMPTYHLANIVDDHLMKITHVIRGEEWLPSLALHILLYDALGWEPPEFAHLPLILKPSGKGKLSKRDGEKHGFPVFPLEWKDPKSGQVSAGYREDYYLPEAVVNMLVLLGWNDTSDQEIFSL
ncbi:MAG: glutamate--tRNA ligase, partial [Psychroflexus sp.]|nr:glutamate--tRNA ligase [Psychroflexus sp.]